LLGYKADPQGNMGLSMRRNFEGQRPVFSALTRAALPVALLTSLLLGACTTTEGTNAFNDFETFENEVMISTAAGFGLVERPEKEETNQRRGPLVLPKDGGALPAPVDGTKVAALPEDSDSVRIDTNGLTEDDIKRLRNARVVDSRTLSGRPLTEAETRKLTARMTAAKLSSTPRPLYLPPEEYFTNIEGTDLVCMSKSGELVPVSHKDCPYEIKAAIGKREAQSPGILGGDPGRDLSGTVGQ
jgi:hypothetical protein